MVPFEVYSTQYFVALAQITAGVVYKKQTNKQRLNKIVQDQIIVQQWKSYFGIYQQSVEQNFLFCRKYWKWNQSQYHKTED